jgi:thiaminase/transcriptional activator TenA
MTAFSARLFSTAQPILDAIEKESFVQGLAHGHLPQEALVFYVQQDFNYLNAFMKVYASAILKCESREDIAFFHGQIGFILNSEIHPHHVLCDVAGVEYESLWYAPQAPTTYLYNEHMYNAARTGDLIDVAAAMTACPWVYGEVARRLVAQGLDGADNPFAPWIDFYADPMLDGEESVTESLQRIIDREAEHYDAERLDEVEARFLRSCELEYRFFEQAFHQDDWTFADVIGRALAPAAVSSAAPAEPALAG